MKRLFVVLLALAMLVACLPTPEKEYVVNKGDNTVEQKLNATPKPGKTHETTGENRPETAENKPDTTSENRGNPAENEPEAPRDRLFPEHWQEKESKLADGLFFKADAEILQRADGRYPVMKTRAAEVKAEDVISQIEKLLPRPVNAFDMVKTKQDYIAEFQSFLDEVADRQAWVDAGKPPRADWDGSDPDPAYIEEETNWYMERINQAPEEQPNKTPCSDYSLLKTKNTSHFTLENGETAQVSIRQNKGYWQGFSVSKNCRRSHVYYEYDYEDDKQLGEENAKCWREPTITREEAEPVAQQVIESLGYTDFSVQLVIKANLVDSDMVELPGRGTAASSGWLFRLRRDYGGYPFVSVPYEPMQGMNNYGDGTDVMNKPIADEYIEILVDENGWQYFSYWGQKDVIGVLNPDVELLTFDEVQERIKNTFRMCLPLNRYQTKNFTVNVYRLLLTTYTLHEKNSDDYIEMPCWVVFFDEFDYGSKEARDRMRNSADMMHECLILNAIDGSVIHTDWGF